MKKNNKKSFLYILIGAIVGTCLGASLLEKNYLFFWGLLSLYTTIIIILVISKKRKNKNF